MTRRATTLLPGQNYGPPNVGARRIIVGRSVSANGIHTWHTEHRETTKYSCAELRELRAARGVGSVRRIARSAANAAR